jgi:hypothetical protein
MKFKKTAGFEGVEPATVREDLSVGAPRRR